MKLYITEDQRKDIDKLFSILRKRGVKLEDNRSHPSISAMFRYLVKQELEKDSKQP